MGWKELLLGKRPTNMVEYRRAWNIDRVMTWVVLLIFLLIYFGSVQQEAEIDSCYYELQNLKVQYNISVLPGSDYVSGCVVDGDLWVCDNGFVGTDSS